MPEIPPSLERASSREAAPWIEDERAIAGIRAEDLPAERSVESWLEETGQA